MNFNRPPALPIALATAAAALGLATIARRVAGRARQTPLAAIAFDSLGTLFSLDALRPRLADAGLPPEVSPKAFVTRVLRDAFALDAAGTFVPFADVAEGTLLELAGEHDLNLAPAEVRRVIRGFGELWPYGDVLPALRLAHASGLAVAVLTNGSAKVTNKLLNAAGADDLVDEVIVVEEVRAYKPRAEVYLHAADRLGVEPAALALVAAHPWDVQGAAAAGLRTGFVPRPPTQRFHPAMPTPDVTAMRLGEVVTRLVRLGGR